MEEGNQYNEDVVPTCEYVPIANPSKKPIHNSWEPKEVPIGAKIISGYYYLEAVVALVALILTIINYFKNSALSTGNFSIALIIIPTLLYAAIITLFILIAKGLWTGKSWSRAVAVMFALVILVLYIIVFAMGSLIFGIIGIASQELLRSVFILILVILINGAIAGYLIFNKKINECFKGDVPLGVQLISVWCYMGAVLIGFLAIMGAGIFIGNLNSSETGRAVLLGILVFGLAFLNFFIGRGLWRAKNWARILTIICSIIGVLGGIYTIISSLTSEASLDYGGYASIFQAYQIFGGIIILVIYGLIGGYLLFSGKVKEAFKKS